MKGDFSRVTWRRDKHYRTVLMQQGRVQIDADWNEQQDIWAHRIDTEALDIVGAHGGPWKTAGFGLVIDGSAKAGDFLISPGQYYVDGILCENETPVAYTAQPDLPGVGPVTEKGVYLAYLDVWERHITALEDPDIREVALGGPDTATRTKLVWQVKLLRIADQRATCSSLREWTQATAGSTGRLSARAQPASAVGDDPCLVEPGAGYQRLENQLYRVEIHTGGALGTARFKWSRDNGSIVTAWLAQEGNDVTVASAGHDRILGFQSGDWVELIDDTRELIGIPGTLVRLTAVEGQTLTIAPPADSEIAIDRADFPLRPRIRRWNTTGESGTLAVETPVTNDGYIELEGGIQVRFEAGEYLAGDYWLVPARTAIADVDPMVVEPRPAAGIHHHYCRLGLLTFDGPAFTSVTDCRRFFPAVTDLTSLFAVGGSGQEGPPGQTLPQPLQAGVANGQWPVPGATLRFRVTRGSGLLGASGTATVTTGPDGVASCIWTLDATTPSQEVTATLLDADGSTVHLPVRFSASLDGSALADGVRVTGVQFGDKSPLENDADATGSQLASGLVVQCDGEIAPESLNRHTCRVSLELPFPLSDSDTALWGSGIVGYQHVAIAGTASAKDTSIAWTPTQAADDFVRQRLFSTLRRLKLETQVLGRLTLSGNFVWDAKDPKRYLDGDLFGTPAEGSKLTRTGVQWPSGDGRHGGTLEVWFWLVDEVIVSIQLSSPFVRVTGSAIVSVLITGTERFEAELSVNDVTGGNATVGTIMRGANPREWIYSAPAKVPKPNPVDITARSLADRTKSASASLLILGPIDPLPPGFQQEPTRRAAGSAPRGAGRKKRE